MGTGSSCNSPHRRPSATRRLHIVRSGARLMAEIRQGLWPVRLVASVWVHVSQKMVTPVVVQLQQEQ